MNNLGSYLFSFRATPRRRSSSMIPECNAKSCRSVIFDRSVMVSVQSSCFPLDYTHGLA